MSEIIISSTTKNLFSVRELWNYRDLLYFLAVRDIKVKYRQTLIGIAWAILQPLIAMIIFTIFFNKFAGISSGKVPYALFSYLGLIFWNFFSSNIIDVSNSLMSNSSIITKVYFPKIIAPISSLIVGIVDFISSAVIFFVLMLFFKHTPSILDFFIILLSLTILSVFVVGIGSFLSVVNVRYRDIRYALPFVIQLFLFLTPIIYPITSVPHKIAWLLYLNPLTGVLDLVRGVIFGNFYNTGFIFISIVSCVLITFFGLLFFNKYVRNIADVI